MKNWWVISAIAMMMAGCGDKDDNGSGKNDCEKVYDLYQNALNEACKGKSNCELCECTAKNQKMWDGSKCIDLTEQRRKAIEKCEGDELEDAKDCLSSRACQEDARGYIRERVSFC